MLAISMIAPGARIGCDEHVRPTNCTTSCTHVYLGVSISPDKGLERLPMEDTMCIKG
jgi:hypothetical protein